jgi:hypothetical protein
MSFLKKAQHSLGIHSGEWAFDAPGACAQTRRCTGCPDVSTRVRHDQAKWSYREPRGANFCTKERVCRRCSLTDTEQEHSFAFMYYDYVQKHRPELLSAIPKGYKSLRGPCAKMSACTFCTTVGRGDYIEHSWGNPVKNPEDGVMYSQCLICRKVERTLKYGL